MSRLGSDRLGELEQALPLAAHFHETHTELLDWLADVEQQVAEYEAQPLALNPPHIKDQQDAIKVRTPPRSRDRVCEDNPQQKLGPVPQGLTSRIVSWFHKLSGFVRITHDTTLNGSWTVRSLWRS